MDPDNLCAVKGWKGGDQCERWFRRTDMDLESVEEGKVHYYIKQPDNCKTIF